MGALAIGAGVVAGVADQTNRYTDNTVAVKSAEYHRAFSEASLQYLKYLDSQGLQPSGLRVVELSEMKPVVRDAASLNALNPYNEPTCLIINSRPDPVDPTKKKTIGLVIVGGQPSNKDPKIGQRRSLVSGLAGLSVGQRSGTALRGKTWELASGVSDWQLNTRGCNNGANRVPEGGLVTDLQLMAMINDLGQQSIDESKFLHRTKQTDPRLNAMETTITMSSTVPGTANIDFIDKNDIKNVRNIDKVATIKGVGTIAGGNATVINDIKSINNTVTINGVTQINNVGQVNNVGQMTNVGSIQFNGARAITNLATINANGPAVTIGGKTTITPQGNVTASGTVTGGYLEAANQVARGTACTNQGTMALDRVTGAPVFCNRDNRWEFYAGFEVNYREAQSASPGGPAFARCAEGEILVGGGGHCKGFFPDEGAGLYHYLHFSQPQGNTWSVDCFDKRAGLSGQPPGGDATAVSVAICLRPGNSAFRRTN
ncbi:MAG: hypothetical protein RIR70_1889 [Pseudomonadota bacterium]